MFNKAYGCHTGQYRERTFPSSQKILSDSMEDTQADEDFQWVAGNRSMSLGGEIGTREVIEESLGD